MSNFFDNFMGGLAFGMLANNPLFCGMGCYGFGGGYSNVDIVDFGTFANPFPSVPGGDYVEKPSIFTTFANAFPAPDFSSVCQTIWDNATNPDSEYNKRMREMYANMNKQQSEQKQTQTYIPQIQFPFSPFYMPTQFTMTPYNNFMYGNIGVFSNRQSNTTETSNKTEYKPSSSGSDKYFTKMLAFVLEHEGGFVNHRHDKGGATNKGVTQNTYNSYRKQKGLATRSVKDITSEEAREIYYNNYKECGADKISDPRLAMCVFDWANHSGSNNKALQRALKECNGDVDKFIQMRSDFLHSLIEKDRTQEDFRDGWDNRIKDLKSFVSGLPSYYA